MRVAGLWVSAVVASTFTSGCAKVSSEEPSSGLSARCIESISRIALSNPRTNEFAANYVGPLGLTPTSEPSAPPFLTKQAEFRLPDGTAHFFGIEGAEARKALLVRLVPSAGEPTIYMFVIDLTGALLSAGIVENRKLTVLDVQSSQVKAAFERESMLVASVGPREGCGVG